MKDFKKCKILTVSALVALSGMELAAADASVYIRRGLVAQYDGIDNAGLGQHDNTASVWSDLSGNGLHAAKNTNANLAWFDKGWTYLNETKVNGVAPFVLPDNSPVNAAVNSKTFSVDFAVSPTEYPSGNICYVYLGNLNTNFKGLVIEQVEQNGTRNAGAYFENNPYVRSSFGVNFGDQFTIAFTSTLNSHVFYRDGAFDSESTAQDKMSSTTTGFAIGGDRVTNRDFTFRGTFHAARFYSCKLTDDEVKINAALDAVRFFGKPISEVNSSMPEGWSLIDGPYLQCTRSGDFIYDGRDNLIEEDRQVLTGVTQTLSIHADGVSLPPPIVLKAGLSVAGCLKIELPLTIDNGTYTLIDATGATGIELSDGATIELAEGSSEVMGQTRQLVIANDKVDLEVKTIGEIVVIDDGQVHEYQSPISLDEISAFRLVSGTLWASAADVIPGDVSVLFIGGSYAPFGTRFTDSFDGTGNLVFNAEYPIGISAISNDLCIVAGDDEARTIALGGDLPSALLLNDIGADHRLTVSNEVSFAGVGNVEVRSTEGGSDVVFAKKLSSAGNFDKTGAGTLQLRQGQNAQVVTVQNGTLVYSGNGTESSTLKELRSGATDSDSARVSIESGAITMSGSVVATRAGTIDQSGGNVTVGDSLYVGYEGTGGVFNFTGGKMTIPRKTFAVNVGNKAGAYGVLNVSGNVELDDKGNMQIGLYGKGELNQSGGIISVGDWPSVGRYSGSLGVCNITGGLLRQTSASSGLIVGEEGIGIMNISGEGLVEVAGPFLIGHAANAIGEVNVFDGGKIIAPRVGINKTSKSSRLFVDGGTIAANGSGKTLSDFLTVPVIGVGSKGMTIDTGDNVVSVGEPFMTIAANGPIIKTGTGTLNAPAASIAPVKVQLGVMQISDDALPEFADYLGEDALLHRWSFNGDVRDSVGGTLGTLVGAAAWNDEMNPSSIDLTGGAYGTSCVNLGTGLLPTDGSAITIEVWGTVHEGQNYSRVFSIGTGTDNQFTVTWCAAYDTTKIVPYLVRRGSTILNKTVTTGQLKERRLHIVMMATPQADGKSLVRWILRDLDTWTLLADGSATTTAAWTPSDFASGEMLLGRSHNTLDGDASATYEEVRIWKGVLPAAQLERSAKLGPDLLPLVPSERKYSTIEVSAGATFSVGSNSLTAETVCGTGMLVGEGTITVETLDVAGGEIGTLTVNGSLVVKNWLLDVESGAVCDKIEGVGTLDVSNLELSVRDPGKLMGAYKLAEVGSITGTPKRVKGLKGWHLVSDGQRLVLSREGMMIFVR